jgi:hypothetical protein
VEKENGVKSFRGTFIFTVLVIAFGIFTYFQVFKKGNEEKEQKEKESQLYKVKIEDVSRIEMVRGSEQIQIDKKGDDWVLTKPLADKADASVVKNFLETLLREKTSAEVEQSETTDPKIFGLDQPSFKIKLMTATNATGEEVIFGSVKAYDSSEYVQFAGQKKVFLASSYLGAMLNKKTDDFRNKNLYGTVVADVDQIKILGIEKIELKREKDTWSMIEPKSFDMPVSREAVQNFLEQVRAMKGTDIVSNTKDLAPYRLNKTPHVLQLHRTQEPQNFEMKISEPKDAKDQIYFATSSDISGILKIAPTSVDIINKRAFDFTNKNFPFAFKTADAATVKIKTKDIQLELKKDGVVWKNIDPASRLEINSTSVENILGKLSHLDADSMTHSKSQNKLIDEIEIKNAKSEVLLKMAWSESLENKKNEAKKYISVTTDKVKEPIVLQQSQMDSLALKDIFKKADVPPIQATPRNGKFLDGAPATVPPPPAEKDK